MNFLFKQRKIEQELTDDSTSLEQDKYAKELPDDPEFWDQVHYAKELNHWPGEYKGRHWKERIFYRRLLKAIPEFSEFKVGRFETIYRVTHNQNILIIDAIPLFKPNEQDSINEKQNTRPFLKYFIKFVFKDFKTIFELLFRKKLDKRIIYFRQKGDIQIELSRANNHTKYGVILNHRKQIAKALFKYESNSVNKTEKDPYLYDKASIDELSYFLVSSGVVEMHIDWP